MAQYDHRVDLNRSSFPLLTSELGRSVLISNNRSTPTNESPNEPEILYCHNIMPNNRGIQSVGFKDVIAAPVAPADSSLFTKVLQIPNVENSTAAGIFYTDRPARLAYTNDPIRKFYVNGHEATTWVLDGVVFGDNRIDPTVANVNGRTYVLMRQDLPGTVDETDALTLRAFIGSPFNNINGITDAFGYLIAWGTDVGGSIGNNLIAWSSLLNPLDLTPSAITGAGNGRVEGAKGEILFCVPNSKGFLVYCRSNVVAAIYTGNKQYPFRFIPVENSKGLDDPNVSVGGQRDMEGRIAYEADNFAHFTWSPVAGMQLVSSVKAETILPEVTDFLAGRQVEDFNEVTKAFSIATVAADSFMKKRIAYIATRYLVISYGITEFTHALIYDNILQKLGKIRFTHVDVFEHNHRQIGTVNRDLAKESIAFIDKDGKVTLLSFNPIDTVRTGVLILGKYQHHRSRFLTLQQVTAENVDAADSFTFTDMTSLDGTNINALVTGTETVGTVGYREFKLRSSAWNHSLCFIGEFILSSIELIYSIGGRKR